MLFLSNYHSVDDFPSFGSSLIRPIFQSLGITSFVHISLKRSVKTLSAKCMSVLSISVQMLSIPGAFPDLICYIACVTSCSVGTPVVISRSIRWININELTFRKGVRTILTNWRNNKLVMISPQPSIQITLFIFNQFT